eukprot:TRINITY_DN6129_c0_g1_i1.p2 TRINITY_DN6129_c0_g1~~TRINITY_DN6129_c0_g1_i1.p2  ORF type:complete len:208 (+),score=-22.45 TRINITY_DN6129_c0_g1_i1:181-804(+)
MIIYLLSILFLLILFLFTTVPQNSTFNRDPNIKKIQQKENYIRYLDIIRFKLYMFFFPTQNLNQLHQLQSLHKFIILKVQLKLQSANKQAQNNIYFLAITQQQQQIILHEFFYLIHSIISFYQHYYSQLLNKIKYIYGGTPILLFLIIIICKTLFLRPEKYAKNIALYIYSYIHSYLMLTPKIFDVQINARIFQNQQNAIKCFEIRN